MRAARIPMIPKGVAIESRKPNLKKGKQLVLKFDDDRNVVIAEAYMDPNKAPIFIREWSLPKVKPGPGIKEIFRSNAEIGASFKTF